MQIQIEENVGSLSILLSGIGNQLTDFRRFYRDYLSQYVYDRIDDIFDSQGDGTWAALSSSYEAQKARQFPGKPILRRTDRYFRAATGPNRPMSFTRITPTELVMGVTVPYAIYHEDGTGRRHRPVYSLIPRDPQFNEHITQLAEKWKREEITILERSLR